VKRREFITLLGGAAASWPFPMWARQAGQMRRVGVLLNFPVDDPEGRTRLGAFLKGLEELGWTDGRNVRIDIRWAADDPARYRQYATELVALAPDVIMASASPSVASVQQVSRAVPIVFANVVDPVGAGFVASLARPGGNATGFTLFEYALSAKWLELLKEIAPHMTRAAVLRDPALAAEIGQLAAIQSVAPSLRVELTPIDLRDPGQIERDITAFAREPNGGLIVTLSPWGATHHELIISLATRYRLPNVFAFRYCPATGGLASYGPDSTDEYKRAADYVDRILKGEKPPDLPVQTPTRYELVINLKTAKALGLDVPTSLLVRADEVIE
jgi:putative ABC transport system substrate-binding protein